MKKVPARIFAIVIIFAIFIGSIEILNYMLIDDASAFTRYMMHEFYNQDNIDILCVGASHCFKGIMPSVVSEKTGKNVFLASSADQKPDASYALIVEAVKKYDIEQVYLEISESIAEETGAYSARTLMTSTYIVSDYMKPSLNKLRFLLGASSSSHYMNSFILSRRNWNLIMNFSYIYSTIGKKRTDVYRSYGHDYAANEHVRYAGNGYVADDRSIQDHEFYETTGFSKVNVAAISDDWRNSIISIIDYCNKHDIKLTLYTTPISNFQLSAHGNFDAYIDYVKDFIKDKDVEYAEFNLLKEEYFSNKQTYHNNADHLNTYGAEEFSNFFADYISGAVPDSAYYSSISEKLNDLTPDYYGVSYFDDNDENTKEIRLISNVPDYYEFKVEIIKSDGENVLLQDYSTNNDIIFSKDYLAKLSDGPSPALIITYRRTHSDNIEGRIEYEL